MKKPITLVVLPSSDVPEHGTGRRTLPIHATVWRMPGYETLKPAWMDLARKAPPRVELPASDLRTSEFLAMLAHELRNPLEPIRSAAGLLARLRADGPLIEQKAVAVIQRQVHHLTRLVDDLLDVSRLNYGKIQLHTEPVLISNVIDAAIDANSAFALGHRLRFQVDLPQTPQWVMGDVVRLTQVFSNLLHLSLIHI